MSTEARVPGVTELREKWGVFSKEYSRSFEPYFHPLAASLMSGLRLHEAKAVVEVGCGPGANTAELWMKHLKPRGASLSSSDLTPEMVEIAKSRIAAVDALIDPTAAAASAEAKVDLRVANAEELPYPDASFDRYFSNLTLMLVPDADKAIREAFRVLKPGGLVGFTVWGNPAESPMFTLFPQCLAAVAPSAAAPPVRSNFYLSQDPEATKKRFQAAGFTGKYVTWHFPVVTETMNVAEFVDKLVLGGTDKAAALARLSEEQRTQLRQLAIEQSEKLLAEGKPLGFNAYVIVAEKPNV